ncbi:S9 family peptidase [Marinibaculum pumilum]|uniref:S9 family peptidase n=1 Tax=Marinibaculum pumilum TaxID=1766165 RepID=A0ABV7KZZ0_9PROT
MNDAKAFRGLPPPPRALRRPQRHEAHGTAWEDPYHWLRDDNWQAVMRDPTQLDAGIRGHLEAENAYTSAALADTAGLQETIFAEIRGRIREDEAGVPVPEDGFAYYSRFRTGGQHPLFCRLPLAAVAEWTPAGPPPPSEQLLLDGDALAEGHAYCDIGGGEPSSDHRLFAYALDLKGSEFFAIRVRDLATGADLPDVLEDSNGSFVWAENGQTLFYTVLDENHRPYGVKRHRLGDDPAGDPLVYREADPGFFVGVGKTASRRWLVISAHDHTTAELRICPADRPDADWRLVAPRERDVEYDLEDLGPQDGERNGGDRFVIRTNADGAEDFKLVTAPVDDPGRANWSDLVPHQPGRLIVGLRVTARHLAWLQRVDALPQIVVRDQLDGSQHQIAMAEEVYSLGLGADMPFDGSLLRYTYSSPTTPDQVIDYDMTARRGTLRKTREVPSGHDPADYVARRLLAPAPDGETVPVSVLHRADLVPGPETPCLLYGYGSYGITIPAGFAPGRLSLVDRGFVFAIAHVRGGQARGRRWYLDGKGPKKTNTFTDTIAAAEHMVAEGLTGAGRIAVQGGSAGGMLVGAVLNMRPDLFGAAVGEVPFVDVLNTMLDDSLPLTPPEWQEWGNPIEDAAAFATIRDYAPYENLADRPYPPVLATAGLTDPRVTYWEPAKWIARLREVAPDAGPYLLKTYMEAGHAGAAGRWDRLKETALVYAFIVKVLGREK